MKIEELNVKFQLPGCQSLKEKRGRLAGLRDRFGRQPHIAVCESGFPDEIQKAHWTFLILGQEQRLIDQTISAIEQFLNENIDARVTEITRERL